MDTSIEVLEPEIITSYRIANTFVDNKAIRTASAKFHQIGPRMYIDDLF